MASKREEYFARKYLVGNLMAEICRVLEQPAPAVEPEQKGAGGRTQERTLPTKLVRISGQDVQEEFLSDRVIDLEVTETARGLSRAKVVIRNDKLLFTDHDLTQGKSVDVELFTGWSNTRMVGRGKFRASVPRYLFRNKAVPLIKLQCVGEEWPLTLNEEREVYENFTDSEIAAKIADRNDLKTDIQSTGQKYEHVAQLNMTDMEFLENRALLYGYDVYVEDGRLHFHEPRFEHSEINLMFGGGETGILTSFDVTVDPWVLGSRWAKSGIERITGDEWEFKSEDDPEGPDPVASRIIERGGRGFQRAADLAEVDGRQPRRFIVGDGHENTQDEVKRQVRGYNRASEWIVMGSATVRGIPELKARQVVEAVGLGHLSGDYYISSITHRINARSGYTMRFEVLRPGVGRLDDRRPGGLGSGNLSKRDVTSSSQSAGEAEVVSAA